REFDEVVGFYVNMLPIRVTVAPGISFRGHLKPVFEQLLEGLRHRRFPFRQLVRSLTEQNGPQNQLQAAFYFQAWNSGEQRRYADRLVSQVHQAGEFDLVFEVVEAPRDWRLNAKYRTSAFEPATIERLVTEYNRLLATVATDPEVALERLLSSEGRATATDPWPAFSYPRRCVHELIEDQAARTPQRVAAVFRDQQLTYRELDGRSNQIAHYLLRSGIRPGSLVGVMLDRSLDMLAGLIAVWKAGASYVPLDPGHPAERLAYILGDARIPVLLTQASSGLRPPWVRAIEIDRERSDILREPATPVQVESCPDDLAYVIYTSGSTGKPKGVQITHRSLTHFLCCMAQKPGCTTDDYVLASTTICFDIAALELFLPLVTGARVEILPEEIVKNGVRLKAEIERSPATLIQATPATWKMLLAAELGRIPGVKILCGGEAWDAQLAEQLLARARELWNMYGPTETTVWSSIQKVEPGQPVRLGDPIGNTQFYVFDEAMRPVRRGEVGELFIGGDGLAKGYLNQPELTRDRFVPNPLRPQEVIYRTGDLVRYV
ncbi:MAG: amino acid adenylation domain-containing protein, partial [Verrucomicrobia bacterium]|nr:amino acid adenylation domain-containing protein [Verrucomicrobiota bacterium]